MRVLGDSWCFCNGGGKSERLKGAIFSGKAPAMARINGAATGFLIHRNLLLTTHANLPSVTAAEAAEIRLHNGLSATLFPHRFFITSSVLDLTMVGLDAFDGESNAPVQHPHYLKTCSKPNLELGTVVYLLGYTDKPELAVGEGKVVIATDNLIKLSTDGVTWSPGSAGFDSHGNLSFMVCDPMKLATSPNAKSTSTSSSSTSSWKKDTPMQFGIPIPVICHWLNQHWEGNLDELNKPKLPLIRLMSSGQKSEHSCASFTMRRVFKLTEGENEGTPSSSKPVEQPGASSAAVHTDTVEVQDETSSGNRQGSGIPTPEIYESPVLTSGPVRNNDATTATTQIQLLDINFPPRVSKAAPSPKQSRKMMPPSSDQNYVKDFLIQKPPEGPSSPILDVESTGSVDGAQTGVQSSSSPVEFQELPHEYSSEGETTMYSAETAESRNYTSPREGRFYQVGRSQSCVSHNRWGPVPRNSVARGLNLEKHQNFTQGRKVYSQGATSQRSNDYYSPTVSSIMKKRHDMEQQQKRRPRQSAVHTSPRWNF
ncbi:uncharacterized protein LOC125190621 [Salvia hispanica]|uniref:uncharacterized protein LOC125190621 n=1 Tax=Salvia hispanica TaxID=49212 RepID=UPI00200977DB|nr:uncharacterized protein LOC125190621 [Salvia hispanica]XP_047943924.1 uncharacterized protein LOC125190621 [Salvia hispanica]